MALSAPSRVTLGLIAVLGFAVFAVIVDVGIHAGKIHAGVRVQDLQLGGLTEEEAVDVLTQRAADLESEEIVFTIEGTHCVFLPGQADWRASPRETAAAAFAVGRDWFVNALRDRITALTSGIRVPWQAQRSAARARSLVEDCAEQVEPFGYELRRVKMRYKIWRAITAWPRRVFRIPVDS